MRIDVAASLTMSSPAPATALLQIAVAQPVTETLTVLTGGEPADVEEFEVDGARVHRFQLSPVGRRSPTRPRPRTAERRGR